MANCTMTSAIRSRPDPSAAADLFAFKIRAGKNRDRYSAGYKPATSPTATMKVIINATSSVPASMPRPSSRCRIVL